MQQFVRQSKSLIIYHAHNRIDKINPISFMEINNAEVLAIHKAPKISYECERTRNMKLIIESDYKNVVNWCNSENNGPWNFNFKLNYIRQSVISGIVSSILHKGRGCNGVTNAMSKRGLQISDGFLAWLQSLLLTSILFSIVALVGR